MVRAVDLNELAKTVAAIAWLIDSRLASSMRNPEAVSNHPVTNERFLQRSIFGGVR